MHKTLVISASAFGVLLFVLAVQHAGVSPFTSMAAVLSGSTNSALTTRTTRQLLVDSIGQTAVTLPSAAREVSRRRVASVDINSVRDKKFAIDLFADTKRTFTARRIVQDANGDILWSGDVDGEKGAAMFRVRKGKLSGSIVLRDATYEILPLGEAGDYLVQQIDTSKLPPDTNDAVIPEDAVSADTSGESVGAAVPVVSLDTPNIIDLLVAYTPASRAANGGTSGIEGKIQLAVDAANQAYTNSGINARLNLVKMQEVAFDESSTTAAQNLASVRTTNDGVLDEVPSLRNQYGADVVSLITQDSEVCGIGYVMTNPSASFANNAYSVVYSSCLSSNTLAHELGHNMGSMHDRANAGGSVGAYPYGYGYNNATAKFSTVMAYRCSGCSRIPYFSSPLVLYNGQPTGISYEVDAANSADNARSINNTIGIVAAFKPAIQTPTPQIPSVPVNVAATAVDDVTISLTWANTSSAQTGIEIQRSNDNVNWTLIASVSGAAINYLDAALTPSTLYYYRIRAFNAQGASAWSSVTNATTAAAIALPTAPNSLLATAQSTSAIALDWIDASDNETGFKIERSANNLTWVQIATTTNNVAYYLDSGLVASSTYYYRARAYNVKGNSTYSNTAQATTLPPPPPAKCTLSVSPSPVTSGQSSTLSWTTSNATSFTINNSIGSVTPVASGSRNVTVTATTTYTGTATGPGGSSTCTATLGVIVPPPTPVPSCALSVSPSSVSSGGSATLSWTSANATSISISGLGTVIPTSSGAQTVTPADTTTYTATVTGAGGSATCSTKLTVTASPPAGAPTCVINAATTTIRLGGYTTLSWSAQNATQAILSTIGVVTPTAQGSQAIAPTSQKTYKLTVNGTSTSSNCTVTINVLPTPAITGPITKTLSYKTSNAQVKILQEFLMRNGYLAQGVATEYFGKDTLAALSNFQCANYIACTTGQGQGTAGALTRAVINQMISEGK